jgi:hypothetical protein
MVKVKEAKVIVASRFNSRLLSGDRHGGKAPVVVNDVEAPKVTDHGDDG